MAVLIMGFRLVLSDFGKSARKQVLLLFWVLSRDDNDPMIRFLIIFI